MDKVRGAPNIARSIAYAAAIFALKDPQHIPDLLYQGF